MQKVEITTSPDVPGRAVILIDGTPVESFVQTIDVAMRPDSLPKVWVSLFAPEIAAQLDTSVVQVSEETHRFLLTLGWTPPYSRDGDVPEQRAGDAS